MYPQLFDRGKVMKMGTHHHMEGVPIHLKLSHDDGHGNGKACEESVKMLRKITCVVH